MCCHKYEKTLTSCFLQFFSVLKFLLQRIFNSLVKLIYKYFFLKLYEWGSPPVQFLSWQIHYLYLKKLLIYMLIFCLDMLLSLLPCLFHLDWLWILTRCQNKHSILLAAFVTHFFLQQQEGIKCILRYHFEKKHKYGGNMALQVWYWWISDPLCLWSHGYQVAFNTIDSLFIMHQETGQFLSSDGLLAPISQWTFILVPASTVDILPPETLMSCGSKIALFISICISSHSFYLDKYILLNLGLHTKKTIFKTILTYETFQYKLSSSYGKRLICANLC